MANNNPSSADGDVYLVTVQGEPAGRVQSLRPEAEIREWVAAGYRHPSITADDVKLEKVDTDSHTQRWLRLELT